MVIDAETGKICTRDESMGLVNREERYMEIGLPGGREEGREIEGKGDREDVILCSMLFYMRS